MAATTLALGTSSYALLESLADEGGAAQLKVTKSGSSTTIRATGSSENTIEGLGITTSGLGTVDPTVFGNLTGFGDASNTENNSNINAFANLKDFQASLGGAGDTLNVFGSIEGSRIYLDLDNKYSQTPDGSDLLSVSGSVTQGSSLQDNLIYAGSGNDTIRIAGSIDNAFVFLGAGNDSFTAGSGTNVDIKGDAGNDYIQFKGQSTDVRINSGANADTVVLSGLAGTSTDLNSHPYESAGAHESGFVFSTQGTSAIDLGDGNDSLVLGSGTYKNASFDTSMGNDTISIAKNSNFENTYFQLVNELATQNGGKDKFTSAQGNIFSGTTISSHNHGGDSLVFGSTTSFLDSGIGLAGGSDSIVFGSNSTITNSYINTGSGGDTLVFGSNTTFTDLSINLGGADGAADRIYFNAISKELDQVKITGADSNDVLYIGATAYTYDSTKLDFYNGTSYFNNNNNPSIGLT